MKELCKVLFIFIIWLYSNVKETIYIHLLSLIIHVYVYFVKSFYLTFRIPAAGAVEAAFLVDQQGATVGALTGQVLG